MKLWNFTLIVNLSILGLNAKAHSDGPMKSDSSLPKSEVVAIGQAQLKIPAIDFKRGLTDSPLAVSVADRIISGVKKNLESFQFILSESESKTVQKKEVWMVAVETEAKEMFKIKTTWNSTTTETRVALEDVSSFIQGQSDELVKKITGTLGPFSTKIIAVCDITSKKELWMMNLDGSETRQITQFKSTTLAPAWSPRGDKIAFSVYAHHKDGKNLDLFEMILKTRSVRGLSARKGINSGACYHPKENKLIFTLSEPGNPDLFELDLDTLKTKQMTESLGFDVDPHYSPDGSQIAFTSSRSGKPMIYVMENKPQADPKRKTYAGNYNATPRWSPDGKSFVFAGWSEGKFDLFIFKVDSGGIDRITKNEGNNEDPMFSPDGRFIVFSSNRKHHGKKTKNLWITNTTGSWAKPVTDKLGNCTAPAWSPRLTP